MKPLLLLFFIVLLGCKKEKLPLDPMPQDPSERFVFLTNNYWKWTHEYIDSTAYAKNHLSEWPLSTTDDFMDMYDTCSWDSDNIFRTSGKWEVVKSKACDSSISSDAGSWRLINNDNDFVIVGQDTFHIVELNRSDFKMYYKRYTWVQGQLVLTEYCMWTFKAR